MTDDDWDLIIKVHVKGAYKVGLESPSCLGPLITKYIFFQCARAAWPHFRKQTYGRVINTASAAGLFGSFGQCNYSGEPLFKTVKDFHTEEPFSCQVVTSWIYRNVSKGRFQIQYIVQCYCAHRCV